MMEMKEKEALYRAIHEPRHRLTLLVGGLGKPKWHMAVQTWGVTSTT